MYNRDHLGLAKVFTFLQWWDSPKFLEMSSGLDQHKLLQVSL
jgi:hypothetical protein